MSGPSGYSSSGPTSSLGRRRCTIHSAQRNNLRLISWCSCRSDCTPICIGFTSLVSRSTAWLMLVAKSNLCATQSRSGANYHADKARELFDHDFDVSVAYHQLNGGKWDLCVLCVTQLTLSMLAQSHIGYQYWQAPLRDSLPPVSYVSSRQRSFAKNIDIHTRFTVENSLGAWPGDNKHNCLLGYNCSDPTLLPMDRYGRSRWIEVGAAGTEDMRFEVEADSFMRVEPKNGSIKADGSTDARIYINVDWDKAGKASKGLVHVRSTDGAKVTVTIPLVRPSPPPKTFVGAVQGDGYIALEAAHFQQSVPHGAFTWEEIPFYGRTLSGMAVYPLTSERWEAGKGPALRYDFWATSLPADKLEIILHIGPTLNYVLGKPFQLAVSINDAEPTIVQPIPDAEPGALPEDWLKVVADEVREVRVALLLKEVGEHTLTVWAMGSGLVLERVLLDLGGIKARGYSYLGPPESVILNK